MVKFLVIVVNAMAVDLQHKTWPIPIFPLYMCALWAGRLAYWRSDTP